MGLNTRESGIFIQIKDTVVDIKFGVMDLYTKATGSKIKLTVVGDLSMQMEISMMAIGKMTKLMVLESTLTLTEQSTKESGLTTSNTGQVKKSGQTVLSTKVITNLEKKTGLESFYGLIDHPMRETL